MHIPKVSGRRRRSSKKPKGESRKIRYLFYIITVLLVAILSTIVIIANIPNSTVSLPDIETYSSIALSFLLSFAVFSYLLYRKKTIKQILAELGLTKDRFNLRMVAYGIAAFLSIILFSLALTAFSLETNVQLPTNVQSVLQGTPLYFMIFTFLVAPINEEIFFRGFLVPRFGIIISAVVFAVAHLSYFSISEFAAALFFGLVVGYIYKRTKSLYPSIIAHIAVNFMTITSLLYLGMLIHI